MKTRHFVIALLVLVLTVGCGLWVTRPQVIDAQTSRAISYVDNWLRANQAASSDGVSLKAEFTPPDTLTKDFATTNTVETIQTLTRTSSGAPSAGIGGSIDLGAETAAGNNEVGLTLEAVTTDVTSTSEDFDAVIGLMDAGAAAAERWRVDSGGVITQSAESAATNSVVDIYNFKHGTSGTEANGIGLGLIFTQEVTSGDEIAANIDIVATDVTAASEDFSYSLSLMAAGAAAAEVFSVTSVGAGSFDSGLTVNEDGDDADTRIEGNTVTDVFKVDAGTDRLDFGSWYTLEGSAAIEATSYSVTSASKATYYDIAYTDTGIVGITLDTDLVAYTGLVLGFCDSELNASGNNIQIGTEGAETINEANTYTMDADGECVWVRANGTNWHIINAYLE